MREWCWLAWHLKGCPSYDEWLDWSDTRRGLLREQVRKRVAEHNSLLEDGR